MNDVSIGTKNITEVLLLTYSNLAKIYLKNIISKNKLDDIANSK